MVSLLKLPHDRNNMSITATNFFHSKKQRYPNENYRFEI